MKNRSRKKLDAPPTIPPRETPVPCRQWGDGLEPQAVEQMRQATLLPVAVAGALMPDAHLGYGLPIGGVLATENAVIPYAVGVDIACRMKMTVLDLPMTWLESHREQLGLALERETRFGMGSQFGTRSDPDSTPPPITPSSTATSPAGSARRCSSTSKTTTTSPGRRRTRSTASSVA